MDVNTKLSFDHLLAMARAGETPALGQLLERYRDYLTLLAQVNVGRRLQGKAEAVDLVQETFLAAHQAFPRFRGDSEREFASWLRQILAATIAHLVRRYFGTQRRDVRLERQLIGQLDRSSQALDQGLIAKESSPSQRAARQEQARLLATALNRLPPKYRDVLVLRHLEGLTFPEVARRMHRSVDSVEKLWTRALVCLRQALGEHHESGR